MAEEKILYFDCSSGISGDMTMGALLDLGVDQEAFLAELEKLHLDGYRVTVEKVVRNAITMNHADVILDEEHDHEHGHHHDHEHHHEHGHAGHFHRSFSDIRRMIQDSDLSDEVKKLSLDIFARVAKAEAKVHNKSVDEVQFHEVGAIDSIVDIVGCAILINMIRPDHIYASVVSDGHGFIHCQHGLLSVPVPAVSEIMADGGITCKQIDIETELVTPTGAAIIAELAESFGTMPEMKIDKIGWGAGTKILSIPNGLKVVQGQRKRTSSYQEDEVLVLQTNLDDCTGEMMGYAMEKLLKAGALDVYYTPIYMKKNRPAWCLTVLARTMDENVMEEALFTHTTTIGIRKTVMRRSVLKRENGTKKTELGLLDVKKVELGTKTRCYIEYESAVKLAEKNGCSLWEIMSLYGNES